MNILIAINICSIIFAGIGAAMMMLCLAFELDVEQKRAINMSIATTVGVVVFVSTGMILSLLRHIA